MSQIRQGSGHSMSGNDAGGTPQMFHHVGLDVSDLEKSAAFYKAALEPLGLKPSTEDDESVAFGEGPVLYLTGGRSKTIKAHLAFSAEDSGSVDAFHAAALASGGKDNGAPGEREYYAPNYYAAYVLDPDGNNIEAVCMT
jgi:catechol 2,3-dioxygenase-like lactoylglutathione lyase family enzyme